MTKRIDAKMTDPELKSRWIAALRSGDYEQGQGALKTNDGADSQHCCLGVLCELVAPEGFQEMSEYSSTMVHQFPDTRSKQECYPNKTKMRELGLTVGRMKVLTKMNDDGRSFHRIADYIEENL